MDDDVERIDLIDDFQANRPARFRPRVRGVGVGSGHYFMPSSLARRVFSAEAYKQSNRDRNRQAKVDSGIPPERKPWLIRFMRTCEFSIRNGRPADWYFTHNIPLKVSAA